MEYKGEPIDFEDPAEDAVLGRGKIEDFTWKGYLDFATCTECGRCQSQCPAWNTGKPLSPKLVIMDLRDHCSPRRHTSSATRKLRWRTRPRVASARSCAARSTTRQHHVPESGFGRVSGSGPEQATRPLVGTAEQGGVIDPDVLWSCTTCGACVEQCPVDIEHIDHIVDMRRYQVMMESEFPSELGVLFKNLETKGNPWGQNAKDRTNWIDEVDFDVPVYGEDVDSFDGYEYLFWVGCAGAYEDRAKKTTKAVAELLADRRREVPGARRRRDLQRRLGPPVGQRVPVPAARRSRTSRPSTACSRASRPSTARSSSPARTASTRSAANTASSARNYTVLHHTQLLNRLVRDKKLVPVTPGRPGHHLPRPVLPRPAQQGLRGAA